MIIVGILEDDAMMRDHLTSVMNSWDFVKSVISVGSNKAFSEALQQTKIDVLLADINVEDGSGLESIRLLQKQHPESISIVITAMSRSETVLEAIRAGASGYLYKDDSRLEILESVRSALRNEAPISASIAMRILRYIQMKPSPPPFSEAVKIDPILSAREIEVIALFAKGMSNDEVSSVLNISKATVPVHVRNIYRKLGTTRRTEAIYEARQLGIIP
jgi:DNA-binding NarL/FixJ family response regulator